MEDGYRLVQTMTLLPPKSRPNNAEYCPRVDIMGCRALRFDLDAVSSVSGNVGLFVEFWDPAKQAWSMVYQFSQIVAPSHAVYQIDRRQPFVNFVTFNVIPEKLMRARFYGPAAAFVASLSCTLGA